MGKDAIIYDMDGTLCDVRGIRHYIDGSKGPKNFDKFHRESVNCPANFSPWLSAYNMGKLGVPVLIVTARLERYRYETIYWLTEQKLAYDELYMRRDNDFRSDVIVKREILANIRRDGYNPIYAYDDNPAVVALWKEEGIPCHIVPGWDEGLTTAVTRANVESNEWSVE